MANEIYDSSWWGVALETASSIGTKTEFFSGQFEMNERQEVEAKKCIADWTHITALQDLKQ